VQNEHRASWGGRAEKIHSKYIKEYLTKKLIGKLTEETIKVLFQK